MFIFVFVFVVTVPFSPKFNSNFKSHSDFNSNIQHPTSQQPTTTLSNQFQEAKAQVDKYRSRRERRSLLKGVVVVVVCSPGSATALDVMESMGEWMDELTHSLIHSHVSAVDEKRISWNDC